MSSDFRERHAAFDLELYEEFQGRVVDEFVPDSGLKEMMKYSLFAGGKRFRPLLLIQGFLEMSRENHREIDSSLMETAYRFAVGLECIHTYSLIHDDLPCMDDDDMRRGMPASHIQFGEAEALLAGDALLNLGFELISDAAYRSGTKEAIRAAAYAVRCTGSSGMVLGQYFDIKNVDDVSAEELERINLLKTSALIRASAVVGMILGGGNEYQIKVGERIGDDIGMIFQLTDDLIDLHSTEEESGKSVGSDCEAHKKTYPMLLGEEKVRRTLESLIERIKTSSEEVGLDFVGDIVGKLVGRKK